MRRISGLVALLAFAALHASPARAEVPMLSEADLLARSTHVVVGQLQTIYKTERTRGPGFRDDVIVAEVVVSKVEKGEGPQEGKTLYARWWRASQRPDGWAGPSGLYVEVREGGTARLYLRRDEQGAYDAITPNGVVMLKAAEPPAARPSPPVGPPSPTTAPPPALGETADSLIYEISHLLLVARDGDAAKTKAALAPWLLPDAKAWFASTYGAERGAAGAAEYEKQTSGDALDGIVTFLAAMGDATRKDVTEGGPATDETSGSQTGKAKSRMAKPVGLWYVRVGGKSLHYLVFEGGRWRIAGKMRAAWEN